MKSRCLMLYNLQYNNFHSHAKRYCQVHKNFAVTNISLLRNKSFYIHKNQSLWNNLSLVKFQIKVFVIKIFINKRKIWWRLETTIKSLTVSGSCSITVDLRSTDDVWTPGHVHSRGRRLQHLPVSLCQIYDATRKWGVKCIRWNLLGNSFLNETISCI